MSWASYGDDWTSRPVWDQVDYETRWHYFSVVERCCRDRRWSGELPRQAALRCSDVSDPSSCLDTLASVGLLAFDGEIVRVVFIEEHIPPEQSRPEVMLPRKRKNLSDHRRRKCERGEHDSHCPPGCPDRGKSVGKPAGKPSGKPVTPGTGTGTGSPREPNTEVAPCAVCSLPLYEADVLAGARSHDACEPKADTA